MSNIYPTPVTFVDGQDVTAQLLNAWERQIDRAFESVSSLVSGFDGAAGADGEGGYVVSVASAVGSMGRLGARLPRGLLLIDGVSRPSVSMDLSPFVGLKEFTLEFTPVPNNATEAGIATVGLGAPVVGLFTAAGQWRLENNRITTSSPILPGTALAYLVNTDLEKYKEGFGEDDGANVIPGVFEIAQAVTLCTLSPTGPLDEYELELPAVRMIANKALPLDLGAPLELSNGSGGTQWASVLATPTWPVPPAARAAAVANANIFPAGLLDLWYAPAGGTPTRMVAAPGDTITFSLTAAHNKVHVTVPDAANVLPAGPQDRYVLACAGVSLSNVVGHLVGSALDHSHDGAWGEAPVSASSLASRFNPAHYSAGSEADDLFPQYLLRSGYDASDALNRNRAMLGTLLIGTKNAIPANQVPAESFTQESHHIAFGSTTVASRLFYMGHDTTGSAMSPHTGKLIAAETPLRVKEGLWLGEDGAAGSVAALGKSSALHPMMMVHAEDGGQGQVGAAALMTQCLSLSPSYASSAAHTSGVQLCEMGEVSGTELLVVQSEGVAPPKMLFYDEGAEIDVDSMKVRRARMSRRDGLVRARNFFLGVGEATIRRANSDYTFGSRLRTVHSDVTKAFDYLRTPASDPFCLVMRQDKFEPGPSTEEARPSVALIWRIDIEQSLTEAMRFDGGGNSTNYAVTVKPDFWLDNHPPSLSRSKRVGVVVFKTESHIDPYISTGEFIPTVSSGFLTYGPSCIAAAGVVSEWKDTSVPLGGDLVPRVTMNVNERETQLYAMMTVEIPEEADKTYDLYIRGLVVSLFSQETDGEVTL